MKWVYILFASYILLLSLLPCHDGSEDIAGATEITVSHSHENEKEHCPPLCSCTCCSVSFMEVRAFYFFDKPVTASYEKQLPEHHFIFPENLPSGVWQPPKIV